MTEIILTTSISAPIQKVFNCSRDIDFHTKSAAQTKETAIAGVTSGLIGYLEQVTWRGKHFGIWFTHTSKITAFKNPVYFVDEMVKGRFKRFKHEHYFSQEAAATTMKDVITYEIPYGLVGEIFNQLVLKKHLINFLMLRNQYIKERFS